MLPLLFEIQQNLSTNPAEYPVCSTIASLDTGVSLFRSFGAYMSDGIYIEENKLNI